ncbi:MAG: ZIP family metal transporter [Ruminococcaceae bacterium]|nr:ZIP family metal transporter [Oscillospiraceae bacterium]
MTFEQTSAVWQALLATFFTWGATAFGAGLVFAFKRVGRTLLDAMLGFSGGVMLAASFWSLLLPAKEMAETLSCEAAFPLCLGFLAGGLIIALGDRLFTALSGQRGDRSFGRRLLLVSSITLHNLPEGIAVGVAFGSVVYGLEGASLGAACTLAAGIALQNLPEGTAVSLPLHRDGMSRGKAFFFGQLSGAVEPIGGVFGAWLVLAARQLLPFLLSFAAGAMVYVVVGELVPESQNNEKRSLMTLFTLLGFALMMLLDVLLG